MDIDMKIAFKKSTSSNYNKVLKLAKGFSSFIPADIKGGMNLIHIKSSDEIKRKHKTLISIWELIRSWNTTQFILDGKELNTRELWEIFRLFKCSDDYSRSVIPERHCRQYGEWEGWGCKYLSAIERNAERYAFSGRSTYWYQFGHFINDEIWMVDKKDIRAAIRREIKLNHVYLCNKFNMKKIDEIIKSLPGKIFLKDSKEWKIVYEESADGSELEKRAVSIEHETVSPYRSLSFGISGSILKTENKEAENEIKRNIPDTTFSDIGGIEEIIETVREVIELPLIKSEVFRELGIKPHKGILLYGPPGCGKTLIAKAIANEVDAHFILISGPEILSKYYGESEANLRKIFQEAKSLQPSIIYWDEIDSLTQKRSGAEEVRLESRLVNQLLTLLDGVEQFGNVCVIASTNRKELIDEALLRPGRFDYCIEVKKPTREGCYHIFKLATRNMPVDKEFDIKEFSEKLYGLSGAEITFVSREGAYNCLRRSVDLKKIIKEKTLESCNLKGVTITEEDFELALAKIRDSARTQDSKEEIK